MKRMHLSTTKIMLLATILVVAGGAISVFAGIMILARPLGFGAGFAWPPAYGALSIVLGVLPVIGGLMLVKGRVLLGSNLAIWSGLANWITALPVMETAIHALPWLESSPLELALGIIPPTIFLPVLGGVLALMARKTGERNVQEQTKKTP